MKFEKNNKYFNIGIYVFFTWLAVLIATCIVLNLSGTVKYILRFIKAVYLLAEPLIIGMIVAYLLDPLVDFYERRCQLLSFSNLFHSNYHDNNNEKRWPMRTVPTLLAFLTFILVIGLFILLIKMNIEQVEGSFSLDALRDSLSGYANYFEKMIQGFSDTARSLGFSSNGQSILQYLYNRINIYIYNFYQGIMNNLCIWGIHTMNWFLAFVIAFYLLQDSRRLWFVVKRLYLRLMGKHYENTRNILVGIDKAVAGYIRGEILDSIIITILTSIALTLIRLDFAIIIGIISGIFNLIPYFGPIVGFVLAVIIGLLDPNPEKALYGAIAILIIQQIDGWFIVPKIVGDCVKLHPVIVLLVILIGGNLFGLVGMLLAVPVTAVIRILLIYYFPEYFEDSNVK